MNLNRELQHYKSRVMEAQLQLFINVSHGLKERFSIPLNSDQFEILTRLLLTIFPDMLEKQNVMQYEAKDDTPACFAFLTNDIRTKDMKKYEKMFSQLFKKRVVLLGMPLGCSPLTKYFFTVKINKKVT